MEEVNFTAMADGTAEEYAFLDGLYRAQAGGLATRLLTELKALKGDKLGYKIDRYQHCLQSATRAQRAGESEERVVAALFHDVADLLAPHNHSQVAAAILRPYVSEESHWIVAHHGVFQGYYFFHHLGGDRDARERYRGHPHFEACAHFCEHYDQNCFDPDYDTLPLEAFEPLAQRVLSEPRYNEGYVSSLKKP